MKRAGCIILIILTAALASLPAHDIPASLAQGRDLSKYDDGGVYRQLAYSHNLQRLREFIWDHWTQKRRGFVEVLFEGVDAGTKAYLFIEPMDGRWRIYWDEVQYSALSNAAPGPPICFPAVVTVERCRGYLIFFDVDDRIVKYL
jgi:hypothetical protein